MAFKFFENAKDSGAVPLPNQLYREQQQAFVDMQWDNTSAMFVIKEQNGIGGEEYSDIEAWVDSIVADTTTGLKDSMDFNKLIFKDINHRVVRGLMYQFDNNYWIVNNYNPYSGLVQQCGVRRCNNRLRIVDPLNGKLHSIPCCVDYDMTSPSQQTSRYIITPNNHATVIVQGNELTYRLFKTNVRFMLSGRPFKMLAYQNAVERSDIDQIDTLLYLDLYLDELRDGDDIVNNIANNGRYDYTVVINSNDMNLTQGATGELSADVIFNDEEVDRPMVWDSSNPSVVKITENGEYEVVGEIDDNAELVVSLVGNPDIKASIVINIVSVEDIEPKLTIDPLFSTIKQYASVMFNPQVDYNGNTYTVFDVVNVTLSNDDNKYVQIKDNEDGSFTLTGLKVSVSPIKLNIYIRSSEPDFEISQEFEIRVTSMMG